MSSEGDESLVRRVGKYVLLQVCVCYRMLLSITNCK